MGYTLYPVATCHVVPVHPHSRGVYVIQEGTPQNAKNGSSPLAWGIQKPEGLAAWVKRFIPTRVGYTAMCGSGPADSAGSSPLAWGIRVSSCPFSVLIFGSSPLAWGIRCWFPHTAAPCGSSPLAWGIHFQKPPAARLHRFIPTRVGYTNPCVKVCQKVRRFIPTRVGYTKSPCLFRSTFHGSSPLAWGIH